MDGGIGDGYLVRRAQAGHVEAFNLLVERHQQGVYRVAVRMVGNEADAQDLAQEAFLRAWRGLGGFRGDSSFSTWLYRIVTTTCLKFLRGRPPRTQPLDDTSEAPAGRPDEVIEARARHTALLRAIAALRPEQRAALVLREFEGCSYEEIAAIMGITVPAVKGRLHRARLELLQISRAWT
jgi:RNA polymerase sigma-70 factor, ECF subfamily